MQCLVRRSGAGRIVPHPTPILPTIKNSSAFPSLESERPQSSHCSFYRKSPVPELILRILCFDILEFLLMFNKNFLPSMKPQPVPSPQLSEPSYGKLSLEDLRSHIAPNSMDPIRQAEAAFRQHNLGDWGFAKEAPDLPDRKRVV